MNIIVLFIALLILGCDRIIDVIIPLRVLVERLLGSFGKSDHLASEYTWNGTTDFAL